jgi:ferritin-like protein
MLEPYKIDDEVTGNDGQNEEMIKTYKLLQDEIVNHLYYRGYNITLGDSYDQADRCRIIEENFQEEKRRISSLLIQHIRDFDIDINREKKANWIDKINETRVGNYVQLVDKNHNGVLTILLQKDEKIYSTENMMISFKIVNGQIENLIKDFYI